MNKHSLQLRGFRIFLSTLIFLLIMMMATENSKAAFTFPQVPQLSLTGAHEGYNTDWYPDGRIWLPVTQNGGSAREFLMPVFIDNKWWHYKSTDLGKYFIPDPIYSFKFKILYDGVAIKPIDIVTVHPFPVDDSRAQNVRGDYKDPLAKNFNITWDVHKDLTYQNFILDPGDPPVPLSVRDKGKVIVITGTGTSPLPVTDTNTVDFNVLLYVKFRVLLDETPTADERTSEFSPIYVSSDTIMFNDWNVRKDIAFKKLIHNDFGLDIAAYYKEPAGNEDVGLGGMTNRTLPLWEYEAILPGVIYLQLTEKLPSIGYDISRNGSQPPIWDNINNPDEAPPGVWIMRDPLTVDSGKVHRPDYVTGYQKFTLKNTSSETRLVDIYVESDAPWLTFALNSPNRSKYVQINPTQGYIYYIDNAILGEGADKPDPLGGLTEPDDVMEITIHCDPDLITPHDGEKAGIYEGWITFRSHTARISPVRMKVTFINFRNPYEPDDGTVVGGGFSKPHKGITLTVRNSLGLTGQETKLVFGTGHRATDGVDALFGEFAYAGAQSGFGARWYHPDEDFRNEQGMPFGFGDMLPNNLNPFSESRDIRNINDTDFSYIYLCRFNADGAQNYPVVIEWDTTDFPENAQLFLSDTLNGGLFPSVNMRRSTHVAGSVLSYAIQDPKITSFKIEYTQPRVIEYVDANGNPKIQTGWNLLSLPVRPKNLTWNVFYPNALNRPKYFYTSGYTDEELLRPGIGYFVKYADSVDKRFTGVPLLRITKDIDDDGFGDQVKLEAGWMTIGALSMPLEISYMDYDDFGGDRPSRQFVREHGVYGYTTNKGFEGASVLEPGLGYWIKCDKPGFLKLVHPGILRTSEYVDYAKQNILGGSSKMVIRDNAQHVTSLYLTGNQSVDLSKFELPPVPPAELFDARFASKTMLEFANSALDVKEQPVIKLQGISYPISITMENSDADYSFVDAVTGKVLGSIAKGESRNIEIKGTTNDAIRIEKSGNNSVLSVSSNPNPVLSVSSIKYNLPEAGYITLKLYDALGNEITIDEGNRQAGENSIPLNASTLSSGNYLCKLTSGANSTVVMISIVK